MHLHGTSIEHTGWSEWIAFGYVGPARGLILAVIVASPPVLSGSTIGVDNDSCDT